MTNRGWKNSTGRTSERWPVLLLLVVLLVPTLGVLWFVRAAINNEQLASKQRLIDSYRANLLAIQTDLDVTWQRIGIAADGCFDPNNPAWTFSQMISAGLCDGVVCEDESGERSYPELSTLELDDGEHDNRWDEAERQEFVVVDLVAAEKLYRDLADDAASVSEQALAWQALARCLFKQHQISEAIQILDQLQAHDQYRYAQNAQGRHILPNLELMAIEFLGDVSAIDSAATKPTLKRITDDLTSQVNEYRHSPMTSTQRLFLMNRLQAISPDLAEFATLPAEELALRFLAAHPAPAKNLVLQPSQLADVWQLATPNGRSLMLFQSESIRRRSEQVIQSLPKHVSEFVRLLSPRESSINHEFLGIDAGLRLPGWRLSIAEPDGRIWDAAAGRQTTIYLWTGALCIIATAIVGMLIGRSMRKQIRLANLKNDLVGTVSHELKTPLAGMRLLVDTLLDTPHKDAHQTHEYLQLIAHENSRLSRLIDNFLTFSRMEQRRHAFDFKALDITLLVEQAIDAAGERFREPSCQVNVDLAADLPAINGDADGLITVLLNLLDNAYKYSSPPRTITINAFRKNDRVCLAVKDQGIGLSRSDSRRVFQRFYQVDHSLVREGHGCGLGLSIVQYIVDAHGGKISVDSRLGAGSTFTVSLPMSDSGAV